MQRVSTDGEISGAKPVPRGALVLLEIPALLVRGLIRVYRYTLSSVVGRTCRHLPTCSEYADVAIGRFGLWRGSWVALARFTRCRPGGSHGFDPVPEILPRDACWYRPWRYGEWSKVLTD
jgi:putative membrane protein insertion efficiency factor